MMGVKEIKAQNPSSHNAAVFQPKSLAGLIRSVGGTAVMWHRFLAHLSRSLQGNLQIHL